MQVSATQPDRTGALCQFLMKELGLSRIDIWKSLYSDTITVRWRKKLLSASNVSTAIILGAKASFNLTITATEDSVLAKVQDAVLDHPLLRTTEYDVRAMEWLQVQDQLKEVVDKHGLLKCKGLTQLTECQDCKIEFGDANTGSKLAIKLAFYDREFRQELEDNDEFDPRKYADK